MALEEKTGKSPTIAVCGPKGAGKTSLIKRLLNDSFSEIYQPTNSVESFPLIGERGIINVFEFPQDERYSPFIKSFSSTASRLFIVLDSQNLPESKKLQEYFALAGNNASTHWIINKIDKLESKPHKPEKPERDEADGSLTKISILNEFLKTLQKAGISSNIHFISSKEGDGIQELRKEINILAPAYKSPSPATSSFLGYFFSLNKEKAESPSTKEPVASRTEPKPK